MPAGEAWGPHVTVNQRQPSIQRESQAVGLSQATYYRPLMDRNRRNELGALTTLTVCQGSPGGMARPQAGWGTDMRGVTRNCGR